MLEGSPRRPPGGTIDALLELGLSEWARAVADLPAPERDETAHTFDRLTGSGRFPIETLGDVFESSLGDSRRRTGSHFTPRDLTRRTVAGTLDPLLAGAEDSRIADLRICDPAMGSGAFLLEVARQLASALDVARGRPAPGTLAEVARGCLFGLDRDPEAVEVARASLWLLARPLEGVDAFGASWLVHGDSLVGASGGALDDLGIGPASRLGLEIGATDAVRRARLVAIGDLWVEARFRGGPAAERRDRRRLRIDQVLRWLEGGAADLPEPLARRRRRVRATSPPFHWDFEAPRPFDAFVGNPPFLGGKRISTVHGADYAEWLQELHGTSKNADLCAHFFRRAAGRLAARGTIGFIATNTISQGDTRTAGLAPLLAEGFRVYRAVRSTRWPGAAKVSVSIVHLARGVDGGVTELDGRPVLHVDSRLRARPERPDPLPLAANEGRGFVGCFLRGDGFIVAPSFRDEIAARHPASAPLVRPYLGGEEVNTSPSQSFFRWVIDFGDASLEEASQHPALLDVLRTRVKPTRDRLRDDGADLSHKRAWWRFANTRPEMRAAIRGLDRCLVAARVTKHLSLSFQPTTRVFSEQLLVFAFDDDAHFAVLESRVHEIWARLLSSSLGEGLRYLPSEAFDTFPFPDDRHLAVGGPLATIGRRLHEERAAHLVETSSGLTAFKNRLRDRFVADAATRRMRALYEELDRAVIAAYGFDCVQPVAYPSPIGDAEHADWEAFEGAVVDCLYALNRAKSVGGVPPEGV